MNILNKIKSFEYDKNRNNLFGIKSAIIWGHSKDTNGSFPMLYISKPKHVSQEDYELLLDNLQIFLTKPADPEETPERYNVYKHNPRLK